MQTLIHRWQEKAGVKAETAHLCRVLGVSRSGVYAARGHDGIAQYLCCQWWQLRQPQADRIA